MAVSHYPFAYTHAYNKAPGWVEGGAKIEKRCDFSSLAADGSGALASTQSRTGLFDESFIILRDSLHANTAHAPLHG